MTLERCPGCRVRLAEPPICPRCGCDLTLVRRAEAQARRFTVRAVQAWAHGNHEEARMLARSALMVEHNLLARGVLQSVAMKSSM